MWAYVIVGFVLVAGLTALIRGWYKAGKSTQEADSAKQADKDAEDAGRARHRYRSDRKFAERLRDTFRRK